MIKRILVVSLLLSTCALASASVFVEGTLYAMQQCEAYLSKNSKTNPDKRFIEVGATYSLTEINRETDPNWYRIEMHGTKNPLRWVHSSCGQASYDLPPPKHCNPLPDNADSYVLALSWQPAFCETYGYEAGKSECRHLNKNSFAQSHLVLHGLWPNQDGCGHHYGFCDASPQRRHCDYNPLNLRVEVAEALSQYMPSYASGSCLERHEWNKHGSCQSRNVDAYFERAIALSKEMNQSAFVALMRQYHGASVPLKQLEQSIDVAFGQGSHTKIYLGCNRGRLVDVYVELPSQLPDNESLAQLMAKAAGRKGFDACPSMVKISDFVGVDA